MTEQINFEITLIERYGSEEFTNYDDLKSYCEDNICEDIIYDYVDDEYGPYYMGGQCFEASDIVRNCGDASYFFDEYMENQFSEFCWEDLEQYDTGEIFEIAGQEFKVLKKVHEKTEEEKAEEERQSIEEEKTRFEFVLRSLIGNIPTNYPHCADLGYIIPIVCSSLTEAIEEKKKIEQMNAQGCADALTNLLNKEEA